MKALAYKILAVTFTIFVFTTCEKISDFGDTNTDPSATAFPETSALLTHVLSGIAKYSTPDINNAMSYAAAIYCQYVVETYLVQYGTYAEKEMSPMKYYSGDLNDLQIMINLNSDESTSENASTNGPNHDQIAIARILQAYILWVLTDSWGDLPYSDALKGISDIRYDTQEAIYQDLINDLTEAVEQFTSAYPVNGDIAYHGEVSNWKKLANSLRMLISLRLSNRYPSSGDYAALQFRLALEDAAGSIENNIDNFKLSYPGGYFRNPYFVIFEELPLGESATMTSLLESLNSDNRQTAFGADMNGNPSVKGVPVGFGTATNQEWIDANPDYCRIFHPDNRDETDPLYIVTASQVLLARAEAADRGWTSETENTNKLYKEGITKSFMQWGLDVPDDTYFDSPNVVLSSPPGTANNLKQIATQQYIANYPNGIQGWSIWRRTGFPELITAPEAINLPPVIPRRIKYGKIDYELTPDGIQEAIDRLQGGDRMDSRVWWDN